MIAGLINQIIAESIPEEWNLRIIANFINGKGVYLEKKKKVDINKKQFASMSRCGTTNSVVMLRQWKNNYLKRSLQP